jgi:RNA polymerase-binding transcription factor DksA
MTSADHDAEQQRRAKADIERELADDHYRRTVGFKLKALAAAMRAEVAAAPGVIHLDMKHHCHLCGETVTEAARSARNPHLFLCADCRGRLKKP